jgi:lantibiotic modifying enzyme
MSGVVYALARLKRSGHVPAAADESVARAVDWLLAHHPTSDDQMPGLHFGEAGVAVAISEAVASGAIESGPWLEPYLTEALNGPLDWPDLTHGAAGQGLAALLVFDGLGLESTLSLAHRCASYLLDAQDADGGWTLPAGVDGMTGARYTGFAHGTAGMAYFLAEYAGRFGDSTARDRALTAADWLTAEARPAARNGGLSWPMRAGEVDTWRWWCHGAPGIALAFMRLYERFVDERHAELARRALLSVPASVRASNLSQCHGLAGLVEIYLEAHRVLDDSVWRERAVELGDVLVELAAGTPSDGVTWLVEDPFRPTADLMVGCGGVAHALLRLALGPEATGPPLLVTGSAARPGAFSASSLP